MIAATTERSQRDAGRFSLTALLRPASRPHTSAATPGAGNQNSYPFKDTMQLVAFYGNNFFLSHAAMLVNEGLPNFIVEELRKRRDLSKSTVGILGTAFKADIDDVRNSLSFKLAKILKFHGAKVVCSDEYARNPAFVSKKKITRSSDIVVIGVPHSAYKGMSFPRRVEVIDLWGVTKRGTRR